MKLLIVGGGGREHALVWKLLQSPQVEKIYCAPGNAGIAQLATCEAVMPDDLEGQLALAKKHQVDLVIVGPEKPLAMGIIDELTRLGIPAFGPNKLAAQIEASKIFCKKLLSYYNIPTPGFAEFDNATAAKDFVMASKFPLVLKADGLASGKGVIIANNLERGLVAVSHLMTAKKPSEANGKIIIEEFLQGQECSLLVLTDGKNIIPLLPARDFKQLRDNGQGPNTGGMGSYSPLSDVPESLVREILATIIVPTIKALKENGIIYQGILYAGLMLTKDGPKVLEYNCRFGDPETQVILPLLGSDLLELLLATINGTLDQVKAHWTTQKAVAVVLASKGYPYKYHTGYTINGLENDLAGTLVFHASTNCWRDKEIVTNGGRVLNVVGLGKTQEEARHLAYQRIKTLGFEEMVFRKDIAL